MVPLLGDDTKDSRLPFGAYRGIDPCLLLGGLLLLLRLGLRRRRRGGERLRDGLLLRLLRRLRRPASMLTSRLAVLGLIRSLRGDRAARPDLGAGLIEREREREIDLDRKVEIERLLRDFGGGERLLDVDRERLRLRVAGERERELVE